MTYLELENLAENDRDMICLFGAGAVGKGWGYDLVKAAGIKADFYCDNKVEQGTVVRDGIEVKDVTYLYQNKERVQVLLTVDIKHQKAILQQLQDHGIHKVIIIDFAVLAEILESIDVSGDDDVKKKYHILYDDIVFLRSRFEKRVGYKLDLENPITFNAKMQWLKIYNRKSEYTGMVDKYAVKEYVADRIGSEFVIPTLGVWDRFDEIDFAKLPGQFVLKCTHDSGSVVIVDGKSAFHIREAEERISRALRINYFWAGREWPYKNVPRRIIAEKYMADSSKMVDYKFMCFGGKVKSIFTCTERFHAEGLKVTFFDTKWKRMPFERHYPASTREIPKPENLLLMIELAEKLSTGIPFVRVDFYEIEGRVYFGEMTFFPGGGMEEFAPSEWDRTLGEWIELPKLIHAGR